MRYAPKPLPLVLLLLALAASLIVPRHARGQARVSLQAGRSMSSAAGSFSLYRGVETAFGEYVTSEEFKEFGYRSGIAARVSVIVQAARSNGFQFGIAYTGKGTTYFNDLATPDLDFRQGLSFSYIELPLLVRFNPARKRVVTPHVAVGPVLSYLVGCTKFTRRDYSRTTAKCRTENFVNKPIDRKRTGLGAMANFGIVVATPRTWTLSLDVLYEYGLLPMIREESLKNRMFAILAGIELPLRLGYN